MKNPKNQWHLILIAALLLAVPGCGGSKQKSAEQSATPKPVAESPEPTPVTPPPAEHHADSEGSEAGAAIAIPGSVPEIWQAVQGERKELADVIAAGKLDQVHHIAFHIRDLIAALPQHSSLAPEATTRLMDGITRVKQLAAGLDEAGDAGNAAEVKTLNTRLNAVIEQTQGLYAAH